MASIPSECIAVGGGADAQQERLLIFLLFVLFIIFLFYANPLPSSIPRSLNLHNRQVDDRVAVEEDVLLKGVVVDVEAEAARTTSREQGKA